MNVILYIGLYIKNTYNYCSI